MEANTRQTTEILEEASPANQRVGTKAECSRDESVLDQKVVHLRPESAARMCADVHEVSRMLSDFAHVALWDFLSTDNAQGHLLSFSNTCSIKHASFRKRQVLEISRGKLQGFRWIYDMSMPSFAMHLSGDQVILMGYSAEMSLREATEESTKWNAQEPEFSRFAVDIASGRRIEVLRGAFLDPSLLSIRYYKLLGTVGVRFVEIVVDRAGFTLALKANSTTMLQASTVVSVSGVRLRDCLTCSRAPGEMCGCNLQLQRPSHAFDFSPNRANDALYAGRLKGEATAIFNQFLQEDYRCFLGTLEDTATSELKTSRELFSLPIMFRTDASEEMMPSHDQAATKMSHRTRVTLMTKQSRAECQAPKVDGESLAPPSFPSNHVLFVQRLLRSPFGTEATCPESAGTLNARDLLLDGAPLTRQEKEDMRAQRREQRRERNRQSAMRSNAKRKMRNDARRQGILDARKRMAELLARQRELRAENAILRRKLSVTASIESPQGRGNDCDALGSIHSVCKHELALHPEGTRNPL